jgi:hypothetical protein
MASAELLASWRRTEQLLRDAIGLLRVDVVATHGHWMGEIGELLEHNELGLAFEWLLSIAQEAQWDSLGLLEALVLAAENMGHGGDGQVLRERIDKLDVDVQ